MNTDGGIFKETNLAGIGAIIWNQNGQHMASLVANIGYATNITAELRVIRDGLLLLLNVGIHSIHLKSDSLIVVQMTASSEGGASSSASGHPQPG